MAFKGKFENEIKDEFKKLQVAKIEKKSYFELNKIIQDNFDKLKIYYTQLVPLSSVFIFLNKLTTDKNDIILKINMLKKEAKYLSQKDIEKIVDYLAIISLSLLKKTTDKTQKELIESALNLHLKKNEIYNDGWYYMGSFGVFCDLHRKVYRIKNLTSNKELDTKGETFYDTTIDILNYCVLLLVSLKNTDNETVLLDKILE